MNTISPFLILPVLLMALIGILAVYRHRTGQTPISLQRSLWQFKISLILLAICITIAAVTTYTLTATLYDSGYPSVPEDVQTADQVVAYLQQHHRAIMTNTYALLWFFYGVTVWFLTTLYAFASALVRAFLLRSHQ